MKPVVTAGEMKGPEPGHNRICRGSGYGTYGKSCTENSGSYGKISG